MLVESAVATIGVGVGEQGDIGVVARAVPPPAAMAGEDRATAASSAGGVRREARAHQRARREPASARAGPRSGAMSSGVKR